MKKAMTSNHDQDMPDEIDFGSPEARRTGVRGKYAKRFTEGSKVVLIEPDLTDLFPNAESVNRALRALADIIRASAARAKPRNRAPEKTRQKLSA